jgi:hypothetical protein
LQAQARGQMLAIRIEGRDHYAELEYELPS